MSFVSREAKKLTDPVYGRLALNPEKKPAIQKVKSSTVSLATAISDKSAKAQKKKAKSVDSKTTLATPCSPETPQYLYCQDSEHTLEFCTKLKSQEIAVRLDFLRKRHLCFGCLKPGHMKSLCHNWATCADCKKCHPTILHMDKMLVADNQERQVTESANIENLHTTSGQVECHTGAGDQECAMVMVPVKIRSKNGMKVVTTYAFLDPGSSVSFCSEDLCRVSGSNISLELKTMGEQQNLKTQRIEDLEISSMNGTHFIHLPPLYTKMKMPASKQHIPTSSDISYWEHLRGLDLPIIESEVGLLIGNNVAQAYTLCEFDWS